MKTTLQNKDSVLCTGTIFFIKFTMIIVMIVIGALALNANINALFNDPTPEELNYYIN